MKPSLSSLSPQSCVNVATGSRPSMESGRMERIISKIKHLEACLRRLNMLFYASADISILDRIERIEEKLESYAESLTTSLFTEQELLDRKATHVQVEGKWLPIKSLYPLRVEVYMVHALAGSEQVYIKSIPYRKIEAIRTLEEFCQLLLDKGEQPSKPGLVYLLGGCIEIEF